MSREAALAGTRQLLQRFSELLAHRLGLHFPPARWPDLMRGMDAAARDLQFEDAEDCMRRLLSKTPSREQIKALARHLTVGETYFFRDPPIFDALQNHILPPLIRQRRQTVKTLRIWSAGCSSGEEAYSIAILLQRMIPDHREWQISIIASDINTVLLDKARSGVYNEWSFRKPPTWLCGAYFRKSGERLYELAAEVRRMVAFSYLNLAEDAYPAISAHLDAIDLVLCRNVMMYFEPRQAQAIVAKQSEALLDGGWLIVSPAESALVTHPALVAENFSGLTLFRKSPARRHVHPTLAKPADKPTTPAKPTASRAAVAPAENPPPPYEEIHSLYQQARYAEAERMATQRLADDQGDVRTMQLMLRLHAGRGDLAAAREWAEKAVNADRLDPVAHYLVAVIAQEQGQADDAIPALRRALYLDADFILAHFALGNLYRQRGVDVAALKHFGNALQLLERQPPDEVLMASDDMTAGRLKEIVRTYLEKAA